MAQVQIKKLNEAHEHVMDCLLLNPLQTLSALSLELKQKYDETYTVSWLSVIVNSNAFRAQLAERRKNLNEVIDQELVTDLDAHMRAAAMQGLRRMGSLIETSSDLEVVGNVTDKVLGAMGYSAKAPRVQIQNNQYNTNNNLNASHVNPAILQAARESFGTSSGAKLFPKADSESQSESFVSAVIEGEAVVCEAEEGNEKCEGAGNSLREADAT